MHPYKRRHLIAHDLARHSLHRNMGVNHFIDQNDLLKRLKPGEQEGGAELFADCILIPEDKLNEILKDECRLSENLNVMA